MFDELARFQDLASRGVEGLVALIRIVVAILIAIIRRPRLLLAAILVWAVVSLHDGWLIPIALALAVVAFLIFRYRD